MMLKKFNYILLISTVFLLSMACVMADDSFETNITSDIDGETLLEDCDILNNGEYSYIEDLNEECELNDLQLDTSDVVMSDDDYSCGAASFATVLNNMGVNITLDEARNAVNTTVNGTTMEGIINGANKYNLTSYGINVNINYLNENYIVHMSINGTDHWSVVKQISDDYIILADPNEGNIKYRG